VTRKSTSTTVCLLSSEVQYDKRQQSKAITAHSNDVMAIAGIQNKRTLAALLPSRVVRRKRAKAQKTSIQNSGESNASSKPPHTKAIPVAFSGAVKKRIRAGTRKNAEKRSHSSQNVLRVRHGHLDDASPHTITALVIIVVLGFVRLGLFGKL
jgi:hypothetical protein